MISTIYGNKDINLSGKREFICLSKRVADYAIAVIAFSTACICLYLCLHTNVPYYSIGAVLGGGVFLVQAAALAKYLPLLSRPSPVEPSPIPSSTRPSPIPSPVGPSPIPSSTRPSPILKLDTSFPRTPSSTYPPDRSLFEKYLEDVNAPATKILLERGFKALEHITFEELQRELQMLCQEFNEKIENSPYTIGFESKKSSEWMARLAYSHLKTPDDSCPLSYRNCPELKVDTDVMLFIDDCAYSGAQLKLYISSIAEKSSRPNLHLYVIVPFMSSRALSLVREDIPENITLTLLSSRREFKNLDNIFSIRELRLVRLEAQRSMPEHPFKWFLNKDQSVMYTDWKLPDATSFPQIFAQFLPEIPKPY